MPAVYPLPQPKNPEPGTTTYRVFVGDGALFEEGKGTGVQTVTDGTSNTIMVVESKDAVPWTKPDDLKFDPDAKPSLYGAGSPHPGGFNAAFADGSVRFIKNTVNPDVWKALITRAGGEVITADRSDIFEGEAPSLGGLPRIATGAQRPLASGNSRDGPGDRPATSPRPTPGPSARAGVCTARRREYAEI